MWTAQIIFNDLLRVFLAPTRRGALCCAKAGKHRGEIKKEKVEADLRKLKEDAELRAQVMRETAETKKNA